MILAYELFFTFIIQVQDTLATQSFWWTQRNNACLWSKIILKPVIDIL